MGEPNYREIFLFFVIENLGLNTKALCQGLRYEKLALVSCSLLSVARP